MLLAISWLLSAAITVLIIVGILAVLFFFMYHTFHGDLPFIMKLVVGIGLLIGAGMLVMALL